MLSGLSVNKKAVPFLKETAPLIFIMNYFTGPIGKITFP